jgi:hypothetical protein
MLKEVQVPPALFLGIIGFYASLTTLRAGKGTSSEKILVNGWCDRGKLEKVVER